MRRASQKEVAGFTMVEMIMVIVVVAAIFAIGALVLGHAFESYDLTQKTTDTDWQGRVGMERMVRELREIRSTADLTPSSTSTDPIYFNTADGSSVCFYYDGGTQTVRRGTDASPTSCGTGASQPLADNVPASGLNFRYFDNTGTATAVAANVYFITVTLAVTEGGISETYRATVQPRRF